MNSSADNRLKYGLLALLLFGIEVLIALYLHDRIIRPYIGDLLVVILIYCFVKALVNAPVFPTALGVLLFAYAVETLQYFHVVELLGLGHSKLARVIIGSSFEWMDMLAYTLGIGLVLSIETIWYQKEKTKN
jgi:hypothetical protein